jgi:hypothetical protein
VAQDQTERLGIMAKAAPNYAELALDAAGWRSDVAAEKCSDLSESLAFIAAFDSVPLFVETLSGMPRGSFLECLSGDARRWEPVMAGSHGVTYEDAARYAGVSLPTIKRAVAAGDLMRATRRRTRPALLDRASVVRWRYRETGIVDQRRAAADAIWRAILSPAERIPSALPPAGWKALNCALPPAPCEPPDELASFLAGFDAHQLRLLAAVLCVRVRRGVSPGDVDAGDNSMVAWLARAARVYDTTIEVIAAHALPRARICPECGAYVGRRVAAVAESGPIPTDDEYMPPGNAGGRTTVFRCSGCRHVWTVTSTEMRDDLQAAWSNADKLNSDMDADDRLTKETWEASVSRTLRDYRQRIGEGAYVRYADLARWTGRTTSCIWTACKNARRLAPGFDTAAGVLYSLHLRLSHEPAMVHAFPSLARAIARHGLAEAALTPAR